MDDLSMFCCLNPKCPEFGRRGGGNLTVPMRYGPRRTRLLRCGVCAARFSERKGTPLFDARLPAERAVSVLEHVAEGVGVRKTARLLRVHRGTVARYARLAAEPPAPVGDEVEPE